MAQKHVVVTGDRPTGKLHLGHYIGSLTSRIALQKMYQQYILIADVQALTDNFDEPQRIHDNVLHVMLDYLAVGIDPNESTIFLQSMIPEIAELTMFYLNLVTVNRLKRNPTVKSEIEDKQFKERLPAGFLVYPVSQAADITIVKGSLVPVGEDQLPMIEQTNDIVRSFNRIYQTNLFSETEALLSSSTRLPGIDGKAKMSKSLNNAIYLSDSPDVVAEKVMRMYTDPQHVRVDEPGCVEGNAVFSYLDAFDPEKDEVARLKAQYQKGGLGDVKLKHRLIELLNAVLEPIRERRKALAEDPRYVMDILLTGTQKTRTIAQKTMAEVREVMYLNYGT